jgi:uncharacterized protein
MMTLDTSAFLALLYRHDPNHARAAAAIQADSGPFVIPAGILAEVTYMVERTLPSGMLDTLLEDLETGYYTLDCGDSDVPRIRALVRRYADLPIGFADAAVVACAERRGGQVLTFDHRHFSVVARAGLVRVVPGWNGDGA